MMETAMILAAGRGSRLRPLTDMTPKPLCPLNGIPIIEYHLTNLVSAGYKKAIINYAHLGGKIRRHLGSGARFGIEIVYAPEPPGGLETGGGILNALPLLGNKPFLTINADIYCDFTLSFFTLPNESLAHLLLVEKPEYSQSGDFGLMPNRQLINSNKQYTFAGIASYHPKLFQDCQRKRFSVTPVIRALAEKKLATGELHRGLWFDIGSFERLNAAEQKLRHSL